MKTQIRTAFSLLLFLALVAGVSASVAQGSESALEDLLQATLFQSPVPDPLDVELVGQFPGPAKAVAVQGSYAYVTSWDAGLPVLRIIDVSDPTAPSEAGFCDVPEDGKDVAVVGSYAYVATGDSGLRIINVSDPANPSETASINTPGYAWEVALAGTYAYVADGLSGLRIIDVSDPAAPSEEGFYEMNAGRVAVMGSYAYVIDGGLRIIDVSDPADPFEAGSYQDEYAEDVAAAGNYAYVAEGYGFLIIGVSDPTAPSYAGSCSTYPGYSFDLAVAGSYAFVQYAIYPSDFALGIVDVSDPSAPSEAGFYDGLVRAHDVAVVGDYIYVADGDGGLLILHIALPAIVVSIDIKPDDYPNSINLSSRGVVPVAVLTTSDFDASTVDPATVLFADAYPLRWTMKDVDYDGDIDLLFHFKTLELNLDEYSTEATLTGQTFDGQAIQGTDDVRILVPPGPFKSPISPLSPLAP